MFGSLKSNKPKSTLSKRSAIKDKPSYRIASLAKSSYSYQPYRDFYPYYSLKNDNYDSYSTSELPKSSSTDAHVFIIIVM